MWISFWGRAHNKRYAKRTVYEQFQYTARLAPAAKLELVAKTLYSDASTSARSFRAWRRRESPGPVSRSVFPTWAGEHQPANDAAFIDRGKVSCCECIRRGKNFPVGHNLSDSCQILSRVTLLESFIFVDVFSFGCWAEQPAGGSASRSLSSRCKDCDVPRFLLGGLDWCPARAPWATTRRPPPTRLRARQCRQRPSRWGRAFHHLISDLFLIFVPPPRLGKTVCKQKIDDQGQFLNISEDWWSRSISK